MEKKDFSNAGVLETSEKVLLIHPRLIRIFKGQPRKYFSEDEMKQLTGSISTVKQRKPIHVKLIQDGPDKNGYEYELVDGQRRFTACARLNCHVKAIVTSEDMDSEEQFMTSVISNFGGSNHTPMEIAHAIQKLQESKRFKDLPATRQIEEIAAVFVRTTVWVYQYLSLLKLNEKVQAMLSPELPEDKRINLSTAFCLANLPSEKQLGAANEIVKKKLPIDKVRLLVRKISAESGIECLDGKRARRPSDDSQMLRTFIKRTLNSVDIFSDKFVLSKLEKTDKKVLEKMVENLRRVAQRIFNLADALSPVKKGRKESEIGGDEELYREEVPEEMVAEIEVPEHTDKHSAKITITSHPVEGSVMPVREVVTCNDVLSILNRSSQDMEREFEKRVVKKDKKEFSMYVRYTEKNNGGINKNGKVNTRGRCYGAHIVLGRFYRDNHLSGDKKYFEKREEIRDERIKAFYPTDIKRYREIFGKQYLNLVQSK